MLELENTYTVTREKIQKFSFFGMTFHTWI